MKNVVVRIRFTTRAIFNMRFNELLCRCRFIEPDEESMQLPLMRFVAQVQLGELEFEGDLIDCLSSRLIEPVIDSEFVMIGDIERYDISTGEGVIARGTVIG